MVEATLMSPSKSSRVITAIMNAAVTTIGKTGVLNLGLILAKKEGRRLSLAIARGSREAAKRPAFAVVIKAIIAAIASIKNPAYKLSRRIFSFIL